MSYGFYKLKHGTDRSDYLLAVARHTKQVIAIANEVVIETPDLKVLEPPKIAETMVHDVRAQGYTGDVCDMCQGSRMKRAGHCMVCEDCGSTTGCS